MRDKLSRQCPQTTSSEEKGEPKRIRTEVPLLTILTPYRQAKPTHTVRDRDPIGKGVGGGEEGGEVGWVEGARPTLQCHHQYGYAAKCFSHCEGQIKITKTAFTNHNLLQRIKGQPKPQRLEPIRHWLLGCTAI